MNPFIGCLALFAAAESTWGLTALFWFPLENLPTHSPSVALMLQIIAFGAAGSFLYLQGQDAAARVLGAAYLVISSTYAFLPATSLPLTHWISALPMDAFLPLLVWLFGWNFPQKELTPNMERLFRTVATTLLVLAFALIACNIKPEFFDPNKQFGRLESPIYGYVVYLTTITALVGTRIGFSSASSEEQDRAKLLLLALGAASVVFGIYALLELVPAYYNYVNTQSGRVIVIPILHAAILSIPITTAYAVSMGKAVRINILFTLFVRYRIAHTTSLLLIVMPLIIIAGLLWSSRYQPLQEIANSTHGIMLALFTFIALNTYYLRDRITTTIERTFFREAYDPAISTTNFGARLHQTTSARELVNLAKEELNNAIHLNQHRILVKGKEEWRDIEGEVPPLSLDSALIWNLKDESASPGELVTNPDQSIENWLEETETKLLTPIVTASGKLVGAMASGAKLSGLDYTRQDKDLLSTTARLMLPHLQRILGSDFIADTNSDLPNCAMCVLCNKVWPNYQDSCENCEGAMLSLSLPKKVADKYDIERRIGTGASGLALLAKDEFLDRAVVLKTLPSVQPDGIKALQEEARSMASLDHPNIATIHELQLWRGLPVLVMEYLEQGTLDARLQTKPLTEREILDLADVLLSACEYLHTKGVIHGDIKPSNIGFDQHASAKLIDFGLARDLNGVVDSFLAGTPLYLSPELLAGTPMNEQSDLWALSITLYEAATGKNPIPQNDMASTLRFLRSADIPSISSVNPKLSGPMDIFLTQSLSSNPEERPTSAKDARELLSKLSS